MKAGRFPACKWHPGQQSPNDGLQTVLETLERADRRAGKDGGLQPENASVFGGHGWRAATFQGIQWEEHETKTEKKNKKTENSS